MAQTLLRKSLIGFGIGLAAALAAWTAGGLPFMETIERKTYDLRVHLLTDPARASRDIVLVRIDEASVRKLEPEIGRWPWPRLAHGTLIDFLSRAPARVITYDILFGERDRRTFELQGETWTGEESDRALAEAAARAGNVILTADVLEADPLASATADENAAAMQRATVAADPVFEVRPGIVLPYRELAAAAAGIGHTLLVLDPDGPARRAVPVVRAGPVALPSLAVATALKAQNLPASSVRLDGGALRVGPASVPLIDAAVPNEDGTVARVKRMLIRFTGPALLDDGGATYQEYSFYDLFYSELQLQAGQTPFVSPERFKNKIVFVGTTAAGLHDLFTVPFARGKMPGMQVHANVVDNLLSRRFMRPAPLAANVALVAVTAALLGVIVLLFGVWWGVGAAVAGMAAVAFLASSLFEAGVWVETARPALASALSLFAGTAYQYFVEGREKRQVKQVFSRFVSRDVFTQLMADPTRASLGGQRREMSVLFADIRGFTAFTERGRAEDVVTQLNEYFSAMVPIVFDHKGTVDKFVGDMIMALFGAPLDDPEHAVHAVDTAVAMLARLDELNARWEREGKPRLGIGVGINSGDMIAGNIGSESIMSYTVIGDAVNLAARLESLNKDYGARIIISAATRSRLDRRYDMRALGNVTVKGKSEPVEIFEVRPMVSSEQDAHS